MKKLEQVFLTLVILVFSVSSHAETDRQTAYQCYRVLLGYDFEGYHAAEHFIKTENAFHELKTVRDALNTSSNSIDSFSRILPNLSESMVKANVEQFNANADLLSLTVDLLEQSSRENLMLLAQAVDPRFYPTLARLTVPRTYTEEELTQLWILIESRLQYIKSVAIEFETIEHSFIHLRTKITRIRKNHPVLFDFGQLENRISRIVEHVQRDIKASVLEERELLEALTCKVDPIKYSKSIQSQCLVSLGFLKSLIPAMHGRNEGGFVDLHRVGLNTRVPLEVVYDTYDSYLKSFVEFNKLLKKMLQTENEASRVLLSPPADLRNHVIYVMGHLEMTIRNLKAEIAEVPPNATVNIQGNANLVSLLQSILMDLNAQKLPLAQLSSRLFAELNARPNQWLERPAGREK